MKTPFRLKAAGFLLIVLSILGILFSLSGIVAGWIIRPRIEDSIMEVLVSVEEALVTSQEGLTLTGQSLDDLLEDFVIFEDSIESLDATLEGVSSSLETSADLIGDDLRQTVLDTQTALDSAAISAELIDNTLGFLSRIPLLGVDYDPDVPLHISLTQVADNLETFPTTLDQIESGLNTTTDGLDSLQEDFQNLSDQIQTFENDLESTKDVLEKFNDSIEMIQIRLGRLNENMPTYLTFLSLFLTGILFWLGLAQLAILTQGFLYLKGKQTIVNLSDYQSKSSEKNSYQKEIQ